MKLYSVFSIIITPGTAEKEQLHTQKSFEVVFMKPNFLNINVNDRATVLYYIFIFSPPYLLTTSVGAGERSNDSELSPSSVIGDISLG